MHDESNAKSDAESNDVANAFPNYEANDEANDFANTESNDESYGESNDISVVFADAKSNGFTDTKSIGEPNDDPFECADNEYVLYPLFLRSRMRGDYPLPQFFSYSIQGPTASPPSAAPDRGRRRKFLVL